MTVNLQIDLHQDGVFEVWVVCLVFFNVDPVQGKMFGVTDQLNLHMICNIFHIPYWNTVINEKKKSERILLIFLKKSARTSFKCSTKALLFFLPP